MSDAIKRKFTYTLTEIASVLNVSVNVVRDDKESGEFRPWDFTSTVQYILRKGVNVKVSNGSK